MSGGGVALAGGVSLLSSLAIAAFVLLSSGIVAIIWPSERWQPAMRPRRLIEKYIEPELIALALIHRDLALHLDASFLANRAYVRRLEQSYRACCSVLVVEIAAWVLDILTKG